MNRITKEVMQNSEKGALWCLGGDMFVIDVTTGTFFPTSSTDCWFHWFLNGVLNSKW